MEAPAVKDGRASIITFNQCQSNELKEDVPGIRTVTVYALDNLLAHKGPVVIDLCAVYVALKDALAAIPQSEQTGNKKAPRKITRTITRTVTRTITRTRKDGTKAVQKNGPMTVKKIYTQDYSKSGL